MDFRRNPHRSIVSVVEIDPSDPDPSDPNLNDDKVKFISVSSITLGFFRSVLFLTHSLVHVDLFSFFVFRYKT